MTRQLAATIENDSDHQRYVLSLADRATGNPTPHGVHRSLYRSFAKRGLAQQDPKGVWRTTDEGHRQLLVWPPA